ncbi:hypothetical protein [Neptunomonas qingdaonensis]|uniref:hypothetical protein n=1 Tax=Neptunomonas qingdaonensis TaxID=1045558 RepID=UPI001160CB81|nr:hypothetical protein [Neptunomonas qingdaonensis]
MKNKKNKLKLKSITNKKSSYQDNIIKAQKNWICAKNSALENNNFKYFNNIETLFPLNKMSGGISLPTKNNKKMESEFNSLSPEDTLKNAREIIREKSAKSVNDATILVVDQYLKNKNFYYGRMLTSFYHILKSDFQSPIYINFLSLVKDVTDWDLIKENYTDQPPQLS